MAYARNPSLAELLDQKRPEIFRIARKYGATNLRVFGSVARGAEAGESDIDLLVDLEPGRSLFDLGGLLFELEELLGVGVDVVTEDSLHWYIRDKVLSEAIALE
jgi:hypothetical protein